MPENKQATVQQKKKDFCEKVSTLFRKYKRIMVVTNKNVTGTQMLHIRKEMDGKGKIIFGKNSLMRRALDSVKADVPEMANLEKYLYRGAGLIFTNESFKVVKEIIDNNCAGSAAKCGTIAPTDVTLKPQRTSMPPTEIKKFHALNIQCKIVKGTIEITGEKELIKKGQKVGASEAEILAALHILPFEFTLNVEALYDNGTMYDTKILDITENTLFGKFIEGLRNIVCASVATSYPCDASLPHIVGSAFNNVAAIAVSIEHQMKQIENIQKILADPEALAALNKENASAQNAGANTINEEEDISEGFEGIGLITDIFDL